MVEGHMTNPSPSGYEVFIAPVWKRILAELIDVFLFGIILKLYLPDVDYRFVGSCHSNCLICAATPHACTHAYLLLSYPLTQTYSSVLLSTPTTPTHPPVTHTHTPHRVPEVIFEGASVWGNLEDEEAVDVRDTLALFLYSVLLQRLLHSLMEVRRCSSLKNTKLPPKIYTGQLYKIASI